MNKPGNFVPLDPTDSRASSSIRWWHSAVVYQIYPRSFLDSNGDGIGDLQGIISKLDYLKQLGVDVIWLSPIYRSPMDDNGYDISDYQDIAPEFGTLDDFDQLVAEAADKGIGIMLDLVVNHTSDAHPWFVESRRNRKNRRRDFYIWREPAPDGGPPNAMQSSFGGSAWTLNEETNQYYLHLFSTRQPDLNWENPAVRSEIYEMMNWWLARGIVGFRMDVIDHIGKQVEKDIITDGPHLHDFIQEMNKATFGRHDVVTVGEAWSATPASALVYSGKARHELSMVFQFEHVIRQWDETYGKWRPKPFDLVQLKSIFGKWQLALAHDGWNSLFWGNHDLPRAVSRYGNSEGYRVESAKMLAIVLHMLKGTPYIFQGEEIGMTNMPFTSIEQYRDVETLNMHRLHLEAGLSPEEFIRGANESGRDNARTPMQWARSPNAGFSTGTPWIEVNPNYLAINAEAAIAEDASIWHHYRSLIGLRKSHPVIIYGDYQSWLDQHPYVYVYTRTLGTDRLTVVASFKSDELIISMPSELVGKGVCLVSNYGAMNEVSATITLKPFEAFAILSNMSALK
ncbi:alpha-glucosidase [Aliirhizobium smilacinae]|uniref:Alpha-glucosidase n=1 Tax=Aliirhizobium smilacinae TaxID=1395944 RepID=A0A5C4XI91_9HYPH|nr:alpha-glucosidase [Rhizobium smilacinae]TNM63082.1 alpha-glucosidase [Rhizobium smilacinae]